MTRHIPSRLQAGTYTQETLKLRSPDKMSLLFLPLKRGTCRRQAYAVAPRCPVVRYRQTTSGSSMLSKEDNCAAHHTFGGSKVCGPSYEWKRPPAGNSNARCGLQGKCAAHFSGTSTD